MNPCVGKPPQPVVDPTADYQHPEDGCDLVMKGGITSGVVYPPALLQLARRYRFCSVGGTAAATIAAAAAEYGREQKGFEQLAKLSRWLGEPTHLRDLFQANTVPSLADKPP